MASRNRRGNQGNGMAGNVIGEIGISFGSNLLVFKGIGCDGDEQRSTGKK